MSSSAAISRRTGAGGRPPPDAKAFAPRGSGAGALLEGLSDSLWLIAIGAACLVLAYSLFLSRALAGPSRFPLWELFLALGLVAVVGGVLATFLRDEPSESDPPSEAPRTPSSVRDAGVAARSPALRGGADNDSPARERPGGARVPALRGITESAEHSSWGRSGTLARARADWSADEAIAELDELSARLSRPTERSGSVGDLPPWGRQVRRAHPGVALQPATDRSRCGACQREIAGAPSGRCPGCDSALCSACLRGLDPPPCPSCVAPPAFSGPL